MLYTQEAHPDYGRIPYLPLSDSQIIDFVAAFIKKAVS
jgi:hypothetical protein